MPILTEVEYDIRGNIIKKNDVGSTFYYNTPNKPYAISGVDAGMNTAIPQRNQTVTYTSFERPAGLSENGYDAIFTYDGSGSRKKMQLKKDGSNQLQRYYLGGCYEADYGTSGNKQRLYLGGDAYSAPAVYVNQGGSWAVYYICRDYLGSITHLVNSNGTVAQETSYDAWGRLRNPADHVVYSPDNEPNLILGRGYTGHEHLPMFGLINMNARLYDPAIGRFLSPDPYVQAPYFSQNFNRYSYAMNNPLVYIDQDGEIAWVPLLIVFGVGFTGGYVSHGIATDNWGMNAVYSGLLGGAMAVGGYYAAGAAMTVGGAFQYAGSSLVNQGLSYVVPPVTFSIGDFSLSINPMAMFTAGAMGNGSGFSLGANLSASYEIGDWTLHAGMGSGSKYAGFSYSDKNVGFSWHTTKYSGGLDRSSEGQRTGTLGFRYKDWSISHENDVRFTGGDGGDRFRSAALEVGYKDWVLGANVYTNDPKLGSVSDDKKKYLNGIQYSSPLYIGKRAGYGVAKIGVEHQAIGDFFQNGFHSLIGSPHLKESSVKPYTPYIKSGRYYQFSKY